MDLRRRLVPIPETLASGQNEEPLVPGNPEYEALVKRLQEGDITLKDFASRLAQEGEARVAMAG